MNGIDLDCAEVAEAVKNCVTLLVRLRHAGQVGRESRQLITEVERFGMKMQVLIVVTADEDELPS